MPSGLEKRLAEFVDRTDEMSLFCSILDSGDPPVFVVSGGSGVGKSSLMARMVRESAARSLRIVEILWSNTRSHDYLAVMRKIRDDVGPEYFAEFTDLVNFYTVPQYTLNLKLDIESIHVAQNAEIHGSTTGDITGVAIKDSMLVMPRSDTAVPEAERFARLTDVFLKCLAVATTAGSTLVVFMDAVEKMTIDTRKWVWEELFGAIRNNRLENICVVVCGEQPPPDDLDRNTLLLLEYTELTPLTQEHITEYLKRRGVHESHREALVILLMAITGGNPFQIATYIDAFFKFQRKTASGNE